MKRVRIVVAYDGTHYHGWQIQPGKVTIESKLNEALTSLLGEPVQVIGASRTDSGVHARGNVAAMGRFRPQPPYACGQDMLGAEPAAAGGYKGAVIRGSGL